MATIQARTSNDGNETYKVTIRLKGHPTETATFKRKTDAKKWAAATEAAIREGRYFKTRESKKRTVSDLVDRYIEEILPQKSAIMIKQKYQLQWWKKQIGYLILADLSPAVIGQQRDILFRTRTIFDKKRSPASVNRYMAAFSHALTIAFKEWGWLDENPIRKVNKMRESKGRVRFLSEEERIRLLEACENSTYKPLYTIVVLALSTGARKMEVMGLQWKEIDFNQQAIRLHFTKNREMRSLPLQGLALDLLKDLNKVRRLNTTLLFPGSNPKKPFEIRKAWIRALNEAQIEDFRFHDLRHTAASYLAMNGATITELSEILGHKTLQMVKRYTHLTDNHTANIVGRMNEKIFGNQRG